MAQPARIAAALTGYLRQMTSNRSSEELESIQGVLDRVSSYQDGAPEGTVEKELRDGLDQAGLSLDEDEISKLASAIEDEHGSVDAAEVLG